MPTRFFASSFFMSSRTLFIFSGTAFVRMHISCFRAHRRQIECPRRNPLLLLDNSPKPPLFLLRQHRPPLPVGPLGANRLCNDRRRAPKGLFLDNSPKPPLLVVRRGVPEVPGIHHKQMTLLCFIHRHL